MPAENDLPSGLLDVVALLYRADWTTMSLSARVREFDDFGVRLRMQAPLRPPWVPADADRGADAVIRESEHWLLVAPGGRFRQESSGEDGREEERICDGERTYDLRGGSGAAHSDADEPDDTGEQDEAAEPDGSAYVPGGPDVTPASPPYADMLCPAWLPAGFELELAGTVSVSGRQAYRIIGRQRPVDRGRLPARAARQRPAHRVSAHRLAGVDRVEALADAELGILLRSEELYHGEVVSRRELTELVLDPPEALDDQQFADPRGKAGQAGNSFHGGESPFSGHDWEGLKAATSLGASAMSFALRHARRSEPPAGARPDPGESPQPEGGEWAGLPGPEEPAGPSILALIYQAGLRQTEIDAELTTWGDTAPLSDGLRQAANSTTIAGVHRLSGALSDLATQWRRREALRLGLPDHFRIDYIDGQQKRRKFVTQASDGSRRWRVSPGQVSVGPARPLPAEIARIADPAWLLDWRLTGGAEVTVGGRRGHRLRVAERWSADGRPYRALPADAVIDAELGILLRLLLEGEGRPTMQQTLTGVTVRTERDPAEFRIEIAAGTRVVADSGGLMDEAGIPAPVQAAVHLAGKAISTAVKVGGFLDSLRQSRRQQGPGGDS